MFVLTSFQHFLNSNLDRWSLQHLEWEMDSAGYPDKYNFFELGYCGHLQYPYSNIFLTNQVISYSRILRKKTISSLVMHSETRIFNYFRYIKFTNLRPTHLEQKIRMRMKRLINMVLYMELNPPVFIVIWYQLFCFPIQK